MSHGMVGTQIGTLMYSDRKPGDSTAVVSGFGNRLLKAGNRRLLKKTGRAGASIAICGEMVASVT
jgi:hypothetical protein